MSTTTDRKIIDAFAVALDRTHDYHIHPADAPYIGRIWEAFVFDHNERTACCELTPSYYLIHLFNSVELTDAGTALNDAAQSALYERYELEPTDNCYVHCGEIERIVADAKLFTVNRYGDAAPHQQEDGIDNPEERHDAELENIREYLTCNYPF